jgi:hypothetical protein
MNKSWFYLCAIGSLAIGITSCGDGGSNPTATTSPSPTAAASPAASPVAVAPTASPAPATTTTPTNTTATTTTATPTGIKPVSVDVAAGLIPPTDGDNWTKTVSKGRTDPFALLSMRATQVIDPKATLGQLPTAQTSKTNPGTAPIKSGSNKSLPGIKVRPEIVAINPTPVKSVPSGKSGAGNVDISRIPRSGIDRALPKISVAVKPQPSAKPPIGTNPGAKPPRRDPQIAIRPLPQPIRPNLNPGGGRPGADPNAAPRPMEPILASTVGITGIIEVDGRTQVILKLPNESFSRYIEVGDRIFDGKVIVKRVDGGQTLSPIVVLEEAGKEVTRKVGDLAGAPVKAASTTPQPAPQPSVP